MTAYVLGAGGHAKVVVETLVEAGWRVKGLFDDDPQKQGTRVAHTPVLGPIRHADRRRWAVLAIGDNPKRRQLAESLQGWRWLTVVHPHAWVADSVELGPGTVVLAGAIIQPEVQIGTHSIVNTAATVDHDCRLGDYVHLAPGVHLGGSIAVEEGVLLGIGTVVIPGLRIGAWSIVGAGSVVVKDLPAGVKAVGAPASVIGPVSDLGKPRGERDG